MYHVSVVVRAALAVNDMGIVETIHLAMCHWVVDALNYRLRGAG